MPSVDQAIYNSSYSTTATTRCGCTAETHIKILQNLQVWAEDKQGAKVYWMDGMAGTGKTMIRYSLYEWLASIRQLGANFFCSHNSPECHENNNIIPTSASQLTEYSPVFRSVLCKVLQEEPRASKLNV